MRKRIVFVILKIISALIATGFAFFCINPLIETFRIWLRDGRKTYFAFTPPMMTALILGSILCSIILTVVAIKSVFSEKTRTVTKICIEDLKSEIEKNREIKKQKQIRKLQAKLNKYKESE